MGGGGAAMKRCMSRFARSSSARRAGESCRPARLMKKVSMRKPDVGPLGLTRGDARARAMVAASRVNRPGGGAVETVVTVATQRRRRPCRARRRDRVRRGRLSILVLSPGSLDQRPSRWPRRARPHPAEPWLRGAREVSEGQRCPTEAPEGHWLWPALPDRHPQPELRAAYGPPSVSAPVLALTGAGAGPVPGLQAVRRWTRMPRQARPAPPVGALAPALHRLGSSEQGPTHSMNTQTFYRSPAR